MNVVFGLHVADIFVLVLYLLGMAVIGFWSAKKIKQSHDFFMPRRFGKAMMVMFGFGAGTHSDQAVGVASKKLYQRAFRDMVPVALASLYAVLLVDRSRYETVSCYHNW